jgi:hypothetical protein
MEKRTNYVKNYSTGRRREIVGLILQSGGLTNRGLRLYWNKPNEYKNKTQIIATLIEEGIIEETKIKVSGLKQIRVFTLKSFGTKNKEYIEEYEIGSFANYKNYLSGIKEEIGKANSGSGQRAYRAAQSVNVNQMMYLAGVSCGAGDMYQTFDARLTKKGQGRRFSELRCTYFQNAYPKTLFNIKSRSRSQGTLIHRDGEAYAVYNIGERRPKWRNEDEKMHWQVLIDPVIKAMSEEGFKVDTSVEGRKAILVAEDAPVINLVREKKGLRKKKGIKEDYLTLPSMYRTGLYYVPFSDFGVQLLRIINQTNWKERVLRESLGSLYGTAQVGNGISHDAYENGVMTLCFTVPDIERLRNFAMAAANINDKSMFKVICFEKQYDFIKEIIGDYAEIEVVSLEPFIRDIGIKEYEF